MSGVTPLSADHLYAELRALIASSRQRLAGAVNAELTRLYWSVGQRLATEVLGGERAQYGSQLMARLGEQLTAEFGRGFEAKNLQRMVQFSQAFFEAQIVTTIKLEPHGRLVATQMANCTKSCKTTASGLHASVCC